MTITLDLSLETQQKLEALATQKGKDVASMICEIVERTLQHPSIRPQSITFDALAAPIRQDFKESEMTDEEFDALIEEVRQEIWQEQHEPSPTR